MDSKTALRILSLGLPLDPMPGPKKRDPSLPHAPNIAINLTPEETTLAVNNALRYFPSSTHSILRNEFETELKSYGHIYMYRFIPDMIEMKAYPLGDYTAKTLEGAAIMAMIMNNLDNRVAQFPQELVTYGGNGQAFSNWAQFWITMKYLSMMDNEQTLSLYSGHPMGLFPSLPSSPRLVITNGMMVPNYSSKDDYNRLFALGVTMYGQMTAGSFCYIGPQGIVHGTVLTLLNAGRKYLKTNDLGGKVFLSSGLGGMSGAQAKAAVICGCIGVIAEVNRTVIDKRHSQGWVEQIVTDADEVVRLVAELKQRKESTSIAFHGNVITLWRKFLDHFIQTGENLLDLASDQTSCHNVFNGGYYPEEVTFEQANEMIRDNPEEFKQLVQSSLRTHVSLINELCAHGTKFWDYGNAFLLESSRAGADVGIEKASFGTTFKYPSYVQDIMGDIFSMGFGPFRWVCMSQDPRDLEKTDENAVKVMQMVLDNEDDLPLHIVSQYEDNIRWIKSCTSKHNLVVGSMARILYADQLGRTLIALAFNKGIREGKISAPIVLSRDHHDVSGTDSPYRETSNITDGSQVTADMAVQNFAGVGIRGATWVALHNGGGVGWGEVINGGFGLLLDGSLDTDQRIKAVLSFDVSNGVSRRSWAGNAYARETLIRSMKADHKLVVTTPFPIEDELS